MTENQVQSIIDFRKDADFKSLSEISTLLGAEVYGAIAPYVTLNPSPYYEISSVGNINGSLTRRSVSAVVEINASLKAGYRVVLWLDRAILSGMLADESQSQDIT